MVMPLFLGSISQKEAFFGHLLSKTRLVPYENSPLNNNQYNILTFYEEPILTVVE